MRKTNLIFSTLVLLLAGLLSFSGCEITECNNDGICDEGETAEGCPADCGAVCDNDGTCDAGETAANCPADCAAGGASVSFIWYIHHVLGGVNVGWGTGEAQEVCTFIQDVAGYTAPPVVQLWEETTGDNVADRRFDFVCSAGQGLTTEAWQAGDTLKYAFAMADATGTLLSQSVTWETVTLTAGENDLGDVDFYLGDYGPLSVDITWADKETAPIQYLTCENLEPTEVSVMGYLLCWGAPVGRACAAGMMYDEVDIATSTETCKNNLTWDIIDFATYTLVIDGEDTLGTTVWGAECVDLDVTSREVGANAYDCQVLMTTSP